MSFFGSNMLKIPDGGWFPLCVGLLGYTLMSTWRRGRQILFARLSADIKPVEVFLDQIAKEPPIRMPGDAIYLTGRVKGAPPMLVRQLERDHVLRERVILLTIVTEEVPRVPASQRLEIEPLEQGFVRIAVHYGFMQNPNLPAALRLCERFGLELDLDQVIYCPGTWPWSRLIGFLECSSGAKSCSRSCRATPLAPRLSFIFRPARCVNRDTGGILSGMQAGRRVPASEIERGAAAAASTMLEERTAIGVLSSARPPRRARRKQMR